MFEINPAYTLPGTYLDMVRLWRLCVGSMGYTGVWPDPGGIYDQAAIMIEAFGVMSSKDAAIRAAHSGGRKHG